MPKTYKHASQFRDAVKRSLQRELRGTPDQSPTSMVRLIDALYDEHNPTRTVSGPQFSADTLHDEIVTFRVHADMSPGAGDGFAFICGPLAATAGYRVEQVHKVVDITSRMDLA